MCRVCNIEKPLDDFHKAPRNFGGRHHRCKRCAYEDNERKRCDPANKARYAKYARRTNLKRYYGISEDEYEQILKDQDFVCAICNEPSEKTLAIDHDHNTGRIRGLLCHRCNTGIGLFNDNPDTMDRAISYLRAQHGR